MPIYVKILIALNLISAVTMVVCSLINGYQSVKKLRKDYNEYAKR